MISIENSKKTYMQIHPTNNNPELPATAFENGGSNRSKIAEINNKISKYFFFLHNKRNFYTKHISVYY